MTDEDLRRAMRFVYLLAALLTLLGTCWFALRIGPPGGWGFALGSVASFGNLWLWEWLAKVIGPPGGAGSGWKAGLFAGRYVVLVAAGYVIVKIIEVNALAAICGLFVSAAAVLISLLVQLVTSFRDKQTTH